jgi:cell fate regulator YaaT (PSP1 superfamily)
MPTIVGVRLRFATKPQYYEATGEPMPVRDGKVVVSTDRGEEIGDVVSGPGEPDEISGAGPFKTIVRAATEHDLHVAEELAEREREALKYYRQLVAERGLEMKPIGVDCLFDGNRMVFYFAAEERVDFRDLVRDLAARFHSRIDMRQVGVRDEARMIGGLGHCGEQLCCSRFGGDFQPVSIRMAKEQDLPLNPQKISGLCGRLMCCLRYEFEAYKDFKSRAPKRNAIVETPEGLGKVIDLNTPKERVTLLLEGGARMEVPLEAMDCAKSPDGCGCPCRVRAEALPQPEDVFAALVEEPLSAARVTSDEPARGRGSGGDQGGGKRRSKRGGGGGQQQAAGDKPKQPGDKPKQKQGGDRSTKSSGDKPKPAVDKPAQGDSAESTEGAARPARRRRRRRPQQGDKPGG